MTTTPWTNIDNVDYDTQRMYLHSDTMANGFDAIAAYFEINQMRADNLNGEQNRVHPYIGAEGKIKKTDIPTYTPRFSLVRTGWRFVPYSAATHTLNLLSEIVSEESITDADVFDLSSVPVNVNIFSSYDQREIIEVQGASPLTQEEHDKLMGTPSKSDVYASAML